MAAPGLVAIHVQTCPHIAKKLVILCIVNGKGKFHKSEFLKQLYGVIKKVI